MGLTTTDHEEIVMDNRAFSGNRRTVLSGFAAMGLSAGVPAIAAARPVPNREAWNKAMAEFVRANSALRDYDRNVLTPAHNRLQAAESAAKKLGTDTARAAHFAEFHAYDPLEARFDELADDHCAALSALGKTPAPDRAALKRKIDLLVDDERWQCSDMGDLFLAVQADVARLLGDA